MANQKFRLPVDSGNGGIYVRYNERTVATFPVNELHVVLQDITNDQQAGITAKGLQPPYALGTHDMKDTGRVLFTATASAVTGSTSEALVTLTPYRDLTAGGGATTHAVTSGKRLRLEKWAVTWRNNTAAAGGVTCRFRMLAGTVLVGSPVHDSLNATTSLATIGSGLTVWSNFPDGCELSGTMQFGITQIAVGAVIGFDVHVAGFEY